MRPDNARRPGKGRKPTKGRFRKEDKKWRKQQATKDDANMDELLAEIGMAICPKCTAQYILTKEGCPFCS